jgi:hypothetical protein
MKTISKLQLVALGVGATLGTFFVISAPTLAASLNYFGSNENLFFDELIEVTNDPNIATYADVKEKLKIGEVQGKAGGTGKDLFFSKNGSNGPKPISSSSLLWNKNTTYNWTLDWDTETNQATFKVLNPNTPKGY